jgi:tRNA dimethylallyltransferase
MTSHIKLPVDVLAIVGPTAVGKTEVSICLAEMVGGEVISADSMAVYRGMDVGTAKPSAQEKARAVFHLIDVADPRLPFSVGEFQRLAHVAIDSTVNANPPAIVVGGSGLYVRAAIDGLDESLPVGDDAFRAEMAALAESQGCEAVHSILADADPASAARIHPRNLKRVVRALEIWRSTGKPASEHFAGHSGRLENAKNARIFGLRMQRDALYARIDERVDLMMERGLVEETRSLLDSEVDSEGTAMQGLGYKQVAAYLRGELTLDEAVYFIKRDTRRFARRQFTWFNADDRVEWIDADGVGEQDVASEIVSRVMK